MSTLIQIQGDAYTWTLDEPVTAAQLLADWPTALKVTAPLQGTMVLSSRVAAMILPPSTGGSSSISPLDGVIPHDDSVPNGWLYLPSAIVQPATQTLYEMPLNAVANNLVNEISAAMSSGNWITLPYGLANGGQIAINGGALTFAVVVPPPAPAGS